MTVANIARILWRWWYIAVVPPLLAAGLTVSLASSPRYYTARTEFVFLAPGSAAVSGLQDGMAATLINFTGAVQRRYAAEHDVVDVSSPTATLQGNNIREGVSVMLADAGNQWQVSFNRPVLVVQVIDTSPEAVKARLVSLATDLTLITEDLQRSVGADPKDFITMEAPVENAAVDSFGPTRSGALKGGMAVLLVGGVAGMSLSVAMERLRPHRERRRS